MARLEDQDPVEALDGEGTALQPTAKRLYVTLWAVCDKNGRGQPEMAGAAMARWGAAATNPERCSVGEILADMKALGFIRDYRRDGRVYRFKRTRRWLDAVLPHVGGEQ